MRIAGSLFATSADKQVLSGVHLKVQQVSISDSDSDYSLGLLPPMGIG